MAGIMSDTEPAPPIQRNDAQPVTNDSGRIVDCSLGRTLRVQGYHGIARGFRHNQPHRNFSQTRRGSCSRRIVSE